LAAHARAVLSVNLFMVIKLRAKQRARRVTAFWERQFSRYLSCSSTKPVGMNWFQFITDTLKLVWINVVFRMGLAEKSLLRLANWSKSWSFSLEWSVGQIFPRCLVRPGDVITVSEHQRQHFLQGIAGIMPEKRPCASWMDRDLKNLTGRIYGFRNVLRLMGTLTNN